MSVSITYLVYSNFLQTTVVDKEKIPIIVRHMVILDVLMSYHYITDEPASASLFYSVLVMCIYDLAFGLVHKFILHPIYPLHKLTHESNDVFSTFYMTTVEFILMFVIPLQFLLWYIPLSFMNILIIQIAIIIGAIDQKSKTIHYWSPLYLSGMLF